MDLHHKDKRVRLQRQKSIRTRKEMEKENDK